MCVQIKSRTQDSNSGLYIIVEILKKNHSERSAKHCEK